MKKRMLSMLLTLCMLMAIIPSGASAADETVETGNQQLEQSAILSDLTNYYWFYNIQDSRVWSFTEDGYAIQYWPKNYISLSNAADTQVKENEMTIVSTEAYAYKFDGSTLKLYSDAIDNSGNSYSRLAVTLDLYNKQTSPANMKDSYAEGCIEKYNGNNYFYQTDWVQPDPNSDDWDSNAMYLVRLGKKEQKTGDDSPFVDVQNVNAYFYTAVLWAVENNITYGTDDTHFSPDQSCTRSQVVAFLWRAMGSPAPTTTECPFVDVKSSDYFYSAILWAVENGITYGTDDTHFSPDATVTRADFVTFLWRAEKRPRYNVQSTFVDIPSNSYYAGAVLWAAENKVAYGVDDTHFAPAQFCTRGQVVSFLHRDLA